MLKTEYDLEVIMYPTNLNGTYHIDGLVQECSISIANALEQLLHYSASVEIKPNQPGIHLNKLTWSDNPFRHTLTEKFAHESTFARCQLTVSALAR